MTLALLWEEYRAGAADGFGYSWFCDLYRAWTGRLKPTMRQVHVAGERMFVDLPGHAMEVVDAKTGEIRGQMFVAVLGASSYTYAEAVWSQSLPDWIAAHVAMLALIGGVPRQIVRAGVPLLHRHPRLGQTLWHRARRRCLCSCAGARHALLQLRRHHPEEPIARTHRRRSARQRS